MKIMDFVNVNVSATGGIAIEQSVSDDMILMHLLIAKRDSVKDRELKNRINDLIWDISSSEE